MSERNTFCPRSFSRISNSVGSLLGRCAYSEDHKFLLALFLSFSKNFLSAICFCSPKNEEMKKERSDQKTAPHPNFSHDFRLSCDKPHLVVVCRVLLLFHHFLLLFCSQVRKEMRAVLPLYFTQLLFFFNFQLRCDNINDIHVVGNVCVGLFFHCARQGEK